jgi:hypothetical protein
MIVSIAQPAYLPWLGYLHRIQHSDLHVVLDSVQIGHRSFTNRNRVMTEGGPRWLTVPVHARGEHARAPIHELEVADDGRWRRKHWETIRLAYATAPHFAESSAFWEAVYERDWRLLWDLLDETTGWCREQLEVTTETVRSSELAVTETKSELILALCREVGATTYLSGPFGRDYLDRGSFEQAGIELRFHDYEHPTYDRNGLPFEPNLAALDAIFHLGPAARELVREPLVAGV